MFITWIITVLWMMNIKDVSINNTTLKYFVSLSVFVLYASIFFFLIYWASLVVQGQRICLQCRRHSLIPGSGRSPREGNSSPFQHSCWENLTDRGTWWSTVHGVAKESVTTEQLNNNGCFYNIACKLLLLTLCDAMDCSSSVPQAPLSMGFSRQEC